MAVLIYSEQAGDKLKLLAEVGEDNVGLAVDALLDAEPKLAQHQPFIVFPVESRMVVEVGEIVRPRRDIKINGSNGSNGSSAEPKATRKPRARKTEAQVDQGEVKTDPEPATEAPAAPVRKRAPKAKAKPVAGKRAPGRPKASAGKPAFTRNPASDE